MKSIIISVRPEYAQKILNGEKTLELRKSVPKDFVGWVYMCVTKAKPLLARYESVPQVTGLGTVGTSDFLYEITDKSDKLAKHFTNGLVVARWWFDEYEKIPFEIMLPQGYENEDGIWVDNSIYGYWVGEHITRQSCLNDDEIENYGNFKDLYAWHIKRLEIFDKPMELGEFYKGDMKKYIDVNGVNQFNYYFKVTRAPQSWRYVWVKE